MAYYLSRSCADKTYVILESRQSIGGTWDLFRYPGIRSDSDMYTFGFAFNPWMENKVISEGDAIMRYMNSTVDNFGIKKHIRCGHSVSKAHWSTAEALWSLEAERTATDGQTLSLKVVCRHLVFCTGYYDFENGFSPVFPHSDSFNGTIIHPQKWPRSYDPTGKRIVVIGSGATAVTLIPNLAKTAEHVTMLQRSPTYIAALPEKDIIANFIQSILPKQLGFNLLRWFYILRSMAMYRLARMIPETVKKDVIKGIQKYLGEDYDITHFSPNYAPVSCEYLFCNLS